MDQALMSSLRAGEPQALEGLYREYGSQIQAVAYLIVRDSAIAEDVCIDTIVTGWERAADLHHDAALRTWLLRIATNKSLSYRRRARRVTSLASVADLPTGDDFERDTADSVSILQFVDALPVQMRAALVLRYYADLSVADVAHILGKSPNTIKSQLKSALHQLRRELADR